MGIPVREIISKEITEKPDELHYRNGIIYYFHPRTFKN
jgi:hypothetical protein